MLFRFVVVPTLIFAVRPYKYEVSTHVIGTELFRMLFCFLGNLFFRAVVTLKQNVFYIFSLTKTSFEIIGSGVYYKGVFTNDVVQTFP